MMSATFTSPIRQFFAVMMLLFGLSAVPAMAEPVLAATKPMVNINTASAEELSEGLAGIGPAKAQAIVQYREEHGPFESASDLGNVKGVGPSTLEKNLPHLEVQ